MSSAAFSEYIGISRQVPGYEQFKERWLTQSIPATALSTVDIQPVYKSYKFRALVAAVLAPIVLGVGWLWIVHSNQPVVKEQVVLVDKQQGFKKATLLLSDGKTVGLMPAGEERSMQEGAVVLYFAGHGELQYRRPTGYAGEEYRTNKITTPIGGEYKVALEDGTQVWLNADSELSYPVLFSKGKREVQLKGEAYFEVAKDQQRPFVVHINGNSIQVLGTRFNVSAYSNEDLLATLVEGSIQLSTPTDTAILYPGQAATIAKSRLRIDKEADTVEAIAWKNGYFVFNNKRLSEIIRRLERWYEVKVTYGEEIENKKYIIGRIDKTEEITKPLTILEMAGAFHYNIDGNEVHISK